MTSVYFIHMFSIVGVVLCEGWIFDLWWLSNSRVSSLKFTGVYTREFVMYSKELHILLGKMYSTTCDILTRFSG